MNLKGILPALVTPLTEGGELNTTVLGNLVEHLYGKGIDGLYVGGNTGEGRELPRGVRERLVEGVLERTPAGKLTMVHVGAHRLEETLGLARHAEKAGGGAISSLPPGPQYGFVETRDWYRAIGEACGLPLVVYHFPALSPSLKVEEIEDLLHLPRVAGIKFTSFDLFTMRELKRSGRAVFNGHDEVLAAGLLMGADGGIGSTYNLMADLFVKLNREAGEGQWAEAVETQDRINRLVRILLGYPLIPAIKQVLAWEGFDCGRAVAPRRALTEEEAVRLRGQYESWAHS